jgi:hypothetical protein
LGKTGARGAVTLVLAISGGLSRGRGVLARLSTNAFCSHCRRSFILWLKLHMVCMTGGGGRVDQHIHITIRLHTQFQYGLQTILFTKKLPSYPKKWFPNGMPRCKDCKTALLTAPWMFFMTHTSAEEGNGKEMLHMLSKKMLLSAGVKSWPWRGSSATGDSSRTEDRSTRSMCVSSLSPAAIQAHFRLDHLCLVKDEGLLAIHKP